MDLDIILQNLSQFHRELLCGRAAWFCRVKGRGSADIRHSNAHQSLRFWASGPLGEPAPFIGSSGFYMHRKPERSFDVGGE
jgi:hypothetical protein